MRHYHFLARVSDTLGRASSRAKSREIRSRKGWLAAVRNLQIRSKRMHLPAYLYVYNREPLYPLPIFLIPLPVLPMSPPYPDSTRGEPRSLARISSDSSGYQAIESPNYFTQKCIKKAKEYLRCLPFWLSDVTFIAILIPQSYPGDNSWVLIDLALTRSETGR